MVVCDFSFRYGDSGWWCIVVVEGDVVNVVGGAYGDGDCGR